MQIDENTCHFILCLKSICYKGQSLFSLYVHSYTLLFRGGVADTAV